jgi:hypothetical protein
VPDFGNAAVWQYIICMYIYILSSLRAFIGFYEDYTVGTIILVLRFKIQ